jgi:hypothetical protein
MTYSATCANCGRAFTAKRSTARYCGDTCRQSAYRRSCQPSSIPEWERELRHGPPLARALAEVLAAVPPKRRSRLLAQIAAAAHPDGADKRPAAADDLLRLVNSLRDDLTGYRAKPRVQWW